MLEFQSVLNCSTQMGANQSKYISYTCARNAAMVSYEETDSIQDPPIWTVLDGWHCASIHKKSLLF